MKKNAASVSLALKTVAYLTYEISRSDGWVDYLELADGDDLEWRIKSAVPGGGSHLAPEPEAQSVRGV